MRKHLRDEDIVHIGDGVYLVSGSNTNWVIIKDGNDATLVDSGYPADHDLLLASLDAVGLKPEGVRALLVTHAHSDHIGAAERLRATYGTPVMMHEEEVPHARRDYLHQVSAGQVLAQSWRPGVLPWAVHAIRAGGTAHVPVTEPSPFPAPGPLDLPGAPEPVRTPGHTEGHCAYLLADTGTLISGDALVTAHPTSRIDGPQILPAMFHTDRSRALHSLELLEAVEADVILPGHGPAHRGNVKQAAVRARELAAREGGRVRDRARLHRHPVRRAP
ncbi:MBL fold metallo-hydrolase [Streptomyces sp. VRA16 Mangrove soil]|uniref:MBL fold metallo-hydrolase n=1 Tax=Streptomyces sp. VRA16 Mangrove soil TaxID=2817434 RepID=UPI001A9DFB13|nr:MBL fold metallo-hydrolase [Streptomyces sp. VRA16 Mangrove soil]MBO1334352.1 MBL fold metallo-hydrolase [Streptomyces sp. VRA16 Mangrove soil]